MRFKVDKAPRRFRSQPCFLSALSADRVDADNKVIKDVAVITKGEALGHGMWIDNEFMSQVVKFGAAKTGRGVKCRFTHPGLSADGLGTMVGWVNNFRFDESTGVPRVIGDLKISETARSSPTHGDIGGYVLSLAEEDPEAFGLSISFGQDPEAMEKFYREHCEEDGEFKSPDEDNVNHYPHVRLAQLYAVDVVDTPAANPGGLFSDGEELAERAESILKYAFGLSEYEPSVFALGGIAPERVRTFVAGFVQRHEKQLRERIGNMDTENEIKNEDSAADLGSDESKSQLAKDPIPQAAGAPPESAGESTGDGEQGEPTVEFAIGYASAHADGVELADRGEPWDAAQELASVTDEAVLRSMCAYSENRGKAGYKLPHHRADKRVVWSGVVSSACREPLVSMSDADRKGVREHIGQHYSEYDEIAPWERDSQAWKAYEGVCKQLKKRGGVTNADLATALRLVGFSVEADLLSPPLQAGITPVRQPGPDLAANVEKVSFESVDDLEKFLGVEINSAITKVAGRLPV